MHHLTGAVVNCPLVFTSLLLNLFFIYSLVRPTGPEKIKHPLKLLLYTLIWCTVCYLVFLLGKSFSLLSGDLAARTTFLLLAHCTVYTSMTSSAWLVFFYYTKVVPARRALSAWMKRNVEAIIYSAWIFERLWTVCDVSFLIVRVDQSRLWNGSGDGSRSQAKEVRKNWQVYFLIASLLKTYFFLSMFLMVWSSTSISWYLIKHIQRMRASGEAFSGPKFHSQLRVAISGMVQGSLYMLSVIWITYKFIYDHTHLQFIDPDLHFTVINLYMFGTTLNLWAGQTVFREKTVDIVRALRRSGHNGACNGS